ncbi:hypothetical protein [Henriciella aquimarina]|uniref:hypothetical protein n=1 Tax=Henriciella aquimarina TaxID=545261 RepID=UPI00117ABEC9|nr:hypothetical protein [Henriciella aquimarina]
MYIRNCLAIVAVLVSAPCLAQADIPLTPVNAAPLEKDVVDPCRLQLAPSPVIRYRGALSRGYDSDSSRVHAEVAAIEVEHSGESCSYTVRVEPDGGPGTASLFSGPNALAFNISETGRPDGPGDNVVEVTGMIPRGHPQKQARFQVVIPPRQTAPAGQYVGRIAVSLYKDNGGAREFVAQQSVEVAVDVPPKVAASFGTDPHAGVKSMALDFGTLLQGQEKSLDLSVDANTLYSVDLVSENAGELRHEFTSAGIPYEVRMDGQLVQADGVPGDARILEGVSGGQHSMAFMVTGNTFTALAGKYSDRLTLVITAD